MWGSKSGCWYSTQMKCGGAYWAVGIQPKQNVGENAGLTDQGTEAPSQGLKSRSKGYINVGYSPLT